MKYEIIFGSEELFDNAPLGTELVGHSGGFYKNSPDGPIYCGGCTFTTDEYRNIGFIAARRIIRTPTWTVADQKAGKLPEVGAKYIGKNELNPETELICDFVDGDKCVWGHDKNKKMFCFYVSNITAIETTAEKAQLLEDEFVNDVLNKPSRRMTETDRGFYTDGIRAAYRKHLELAAPKGGDKA